MDLNFDFQLSKPTLQFSYPAWLAISRRDKSFATSRAYRLLPSAMSAALCSSARTLAPARSSFRSCALRNLTAPQGATTKLFVFTIARKLNPAFTAWLIPSCTMKQRQLQIAIATALGQPVGNWSSISTRILLSQASARSVLRSKPISAAAVGARGSSRGSAKGAPKGVRESTLRCVAKTVSDVGDIGITTRGRRTSYGETPRPHIAKRRPSHSAGKCRAESRTVYAIHFVMPNGASGSSTGDGD
jgi:hypothetical protein